MDGAIVDNYLYVQSVVTLEVKPWDDETDMKALEECVRSIEQEGLVWGASKLVAVGFGIKKLQITLVVGRSSPVVYLQRVTDDWMANRGRACFDR